MKKYSKGRKGGITEYACSDVIRDEVEICAIGRTIEIKIFIIAE